MSKTKRFLTIFLSFVMLITAFTATTVTASASTSGTSRTRVLQVWTNMSGSTPSIKLKQNKGIYYYYGWGGKRHTKKIYGVYTVTVKPVSKLDGSKTSYKTKTYKLDTGSLKINLKKDTYYEIIIGLDSAASLEQCVGWTTLFNPAKGYGFDTYSKWYLNSTNNCANYK